MGLAKNSYNLRRWINEDSMPAFSIDRMSHRTAASPRFISSLALSSKKSTTDDCANEYRTWGGRPQGVRASFLNKGESVIWVGNPFGFSFLASKGLIGGYLFKSTQSNMLEWILITGSFFPGYSGSGIIGRDGKIIGMVDSIYVSRDFGKTAIGYAVPAERIIWLLNVSHIPYDK